MCCRSGRAKFVSGETIDKQQSESVLGILHLAIAAPGLVTDPPDRAPPYLPLATWNQPQWTPPLNSM